MSASRKRFRHLVLRYYCGGAVASVALFLVSWAGRASRDIIARLVNTRIERRVDFRSNAATGTRRACVR